MLSNFAVAALAAIGTVSAGPLQRRQETSSALASVTSAVESAVSSAVAGATSVASSAASGASSAASGASSAASSAAEPSLASSAASSSASATSSGASPGNETFPAYPCPAGFLLTYASVNQTVQLPVTQVTAAAGEWATSPLFPNVTDAQGGSTPGATHTINLPGGISLPEVLISVEANQTSGSAIWTWNGSLPEPVTAMGVSISNYSTVIQIYDPDYTTTNSIGNTTFVKIFTNACATPQAEAVGLLTTLGGLELGNIAAALGGPAGGSSSAAPGPASSAASSAASGASSATSAAASGASSAASGASSGASAATSAAASGASAAASGASSVVSAVSSAAASAVSTSA